MDAPNRHNQQRYYLQAVGNRSVAYEERVRAMDFPPEDAARGFSPNKGPVPATVWLQQQRRRNSSNNNRNSRSGNVHSDYGEEDGRPRCRVKTRPVVGSRAADLAMLRGAVDGQRPNSGYYNNSNSNYRYSQTEPSVRSRPASASPAVAASGQPWTRPLWPVGDAAERHSTYYDPQSTTDESFLKVRQLNQQPPPMPQASHVQSPVAKRVAAQQRQQDAGQGQARPRSDSETSFGGGKIFFGWRRPLYAQDSAGNGQQQKPTGDSAASQKPWQYRSKNLHNFSYADAKIYSPQSHQPNQQHQQRPPNRAKIWWTMETMGAVNSAHSNEMMLARGARAELS